MKYSSCQAARLGAGAGAEESPGRAAQHIILAKTSIVEDGAGLVMHALLDQLPT
jgi:hypothetical protein